MFDPEEITRRIELAGKTEEVYTLLQENKHGNSIMHVIKLMNELNIMPLIKLQEKCEKKTESLSQEGKNHFRQHKYSSALQLYNLAILHAPYKSKFMHVAYDNRSELFFKINRYKACMTDIDTALNMETPVDEAQVHKLIERKRLAELMQEKEPKVKHFVEVVCSKYTKVPEPINTEIPCCSSGVKFDIKDGRRVITANRFINIGEILSVETPYQYHLTRDTQVCCCYCCLKYTENLIPCRNCCVAMYCSDACSEKNFLEGHDFECKLMGLLIRFSDVLHLSIKTVIKAFKQCSNWEDLMARVEKVRADRDIKSGFCTNIYNELVFDSIHYESICVYSPPVDSWQTSHKFNLTIRIAIVVNALSTMLRLTPVTPNGDRILAFLGQQMMFHALDGIHKWMSSSVYAPFNDDPERTKFVLPARAIGYSAVAGMLKHACNPNVEYFGFGDKLVLIATKTMIPGCELITCYGSTYLDLSKVPRQYKLFKNFNIDCKCEACDKDWTISDSFDSTISKELASKFNLENGYWIYSIEEAVDKFPSLCQGMATFQDKPTTKYYYAYYRFFKDCMARFQYQVAPQQMNGKIMDLSAISKDFA